MTEQYGIGVDLGGTKILAGVIELGTGKVISVAKKKTQNSASKELMLKLTNVIDEAIKEANLPAGTSPRHIGVGVAGQVDRERGILVAAPNLGITSAFPIVKNLSNQFKLPVTLGNDVEVATLGELRFGAGRGYDNFICVFVGTGIGGGVIQDGEIYRGSTGTAGEIGHITINAGGRLCGCGGRGHLEAYASRTAITRVLLGELHRGRPSVLRQNLPPEALPSGGISSGAAIRSGQIARAVEANDELVLWALDEAARHLAVGLASVVNFFNPRRIILGGGLVEAVDYFFDATAKFTRREALSVPAAKIEIVKASLGDFSGIVGAALLPVPD